MTIAVTKPGGWSLNEELTSGEITAVDANVTNALDKRSGHSDTCGSTISFSGALSFSNACTFTGAVTVGSLTLTGTNRVGLASRSKTATVGAFFTASTGTWAETGPGGDLQAGATSGVAIVPLVVPDGVTITQVRVWIQPTGGHMGAPGTLPSATLYEKTTSTGSVTTVANQSDSYGSAMAYDTVHAITISGLSYTMARNGKRLTIGLGNEASTNAISGLIIHGADVTYTTTAMDDGYSN
jgi:hypothetical protein